jgi:hypothetical protein
MTDQRDDGRNDTAASVPPPGSDPDARPPAPLAPPDPGASAHPPPPADATVRFEPIPAAAPPAAAPPSAAVQPPFPQPAPSYPPQPPGPQPYPQQPYPQRPYQQPPYAQQPYGYAQVAPPAERKRRNGGTITGALLMLTGAVLAIVGSVLPWVDLVGFGADAPNGFETYAFFGEESEPIVWTNPGAYVIGTVAVVALLGIVVLAAGRATWSWILGILASIVAAGVAFVAVVGIADLTRIFDGVGIGVGIVLVGAGVVVSLIGSIVVAASR